MAKSKNKIKIEDFLDLGIQDLSEITRALVTMEITLDSSVSSKNEELKKALHDAAIATGKAGALFNIELDKYVPSIDKELAALEKTKKESENPEPQDKPAVSDPLKPLSMEEAAQKRLDDAKKLHEERMHDMPNKKPFSAVMPLKKKDPIGVGQKLESNMKIDMLVSLANTLESRGEQDKANTIRALIKKAEALNLPEHAPEQTLPEYAPEQPVGGKQEKTDELSLLSSLYNKFTTAPTMNAYEDLVSGLGKYMRYTEEEDVVASSKGDLEKKAEVFEKLAEIADKLDSAGLSAQADLVDAFIKDAAKEKPEDKYDSEKHHSEQIKEPQRQQEKRDKSFKDKPYIKTYGPVDAALSTRHCPVHVGVMLGRIGENTYQCSLDGAVYNWESGWSDLDGNKHSGGSVSKQTPSASDYGQIPLRIFDSRG